MTKLLLCLLGFAASAMSIAELVQPSPPLVAQTNVPYLTGGVGQEELAQLAEQATGFNVKILFADRDGAFITGVKATIRAPGGRPLLQVASGGPILFAKLPPGNYEIEATYQGVRKDHRLSIGSKGRSETTLRW
jgi:hypothetical protein